MVEIFEPRGSYECIGTVTSVKKERSNIYDVDRYHIIFEPVGKSWKSQHAWYLAPKTSDDSRVPLGSALCELLQQLKHFGADFGSVEETMKWMESRTFVFVKRKIGRMKAEAWFHISLKEILPHEDENKKAKKWF